MPTKRRSHGKSKFGIIGSKLKDVLKSLIIDLIAARKVTKITKELNKDSKVKDAVQATHQAYDRMERTIDEFCSKYPEECQRIKDEIEKG